MFSGNNNFQGAALYSKEEIGKALKLYEDEVCFAEKVLEERYNYAELRYQRQKTWWDKLVGNKNLCDKIGEMFCTKHESAYTKGWLDLSKEEVDRIKVLSSSNFPYYLGHWIFSTEYAQVKNPFNGGKDCYLNPKQEAFVNKWKKFSLDTLLKQK